MTAPWGDLRTQLGFNDDFVAQRLGISKSELAAIEEGTEAPDVSVAEDLAAIYGLPYSLQDDFARTMKEARRETLVVLFKSRPDGPNLTQNDRALMSRAAAAAAEFVAMEKELGGSSRMAALEGQFKSDDDYQGGWVAGKRLAERVRSWLGLDRMAAIHNLLDLLWDRFRILVVPSQLSGSISAFSFADELRGPTIVYNTHESHQNVWVWRFTLAHELGHVLFDRGIGARFTRFDDLERDRDGDPVEVRANAFAVHLLMPYAALAGRLNQPDAGKKPDATIRSLMVEYGLNFKAMRLHLKNFGWLHSRDFWTMPRVDPTETPEWIAEAAPDRDYFPVPSIPHERRGLFAREAVRYWTDGRIDDGFLREILRAAPGSPLPSLADLYGLHPRR